MCVGSVALCVRVNQMGWDCIVPIVVNSMIFAVSTCNSHKIFARLRRAKDLLFCVYFDVKILMSSFF